MSEFENVFFFFPYENGSEILEEFSQNWDFRKETLLELAKISVFRGFQENIITARTATVAKEFLRRVNENNWSYCFLNEENMKKYHTYILNALKPSEKEFELAKIYFHHIKNRSKFEQSELVKNTLDAYFKIENEIQISQNSIYAPSKHEFLKKSIFK